MISCLNGRKYENLVQFNASRLASLRTRYYLRLYFSFNCSGYDLTLIEKRHIKLLFVFIKVRIKLTNSLLVTVVTQFPTKTANSKKALYFLSYMSCSINKVSNVIHMQKFNVVNELLRQQS